MRTLRHSEGHQSSSTRERGSRRAGQGPSGTFPRLRSDGAERLWDAGRGGAGRTDRLATWPPLAWGMAGVLLEAGPAPSPRAQGGWLLAAPAGT